MQAYGRSIDLLRGAAARRRRELNDEDQRPRCDDDVETAALSRVVRSGLTRALGALPDAERVPLVLAFYSGHTYQEVASILGIPEGTIKSRIRRGLSDLRENLSLGEGIDLCARRGELPDRGWVATRHLVCDVAP